MPKRTDIHKILIIGSGPIVIGQAAEFDYAGTQACLALREEGYEVLLCNSNPATIMTDPSVADQIYMEPLTPEMLEKIIRKERPDAILPGIGGQTGLNLAVALEKKGVLKECGVELLGTKSASIEQAEDRELFKKLCLSIGEPVLPSVTVSTCEEGLKAAEEIGYPVILRPAFTLGGTGSSFAENEEELERELLLALATSPVHEVLVEKSVRGYKEIEYEVMRDADDTAITICDMENVDAIGVHTGDSIVVCPSQTLTKKEYCMLRDSALKMIRRLQIEGGCNIQFALDPNSSGYYLIEVNPRVSRSSALASKASGYPIARVSAKIAVGLRLHEIRISDTPASREPSLSYIVCKMPRFPFDKFPNADRHISTQMKATGEVMAIGSSVEECLLKAIRSLETGAFHLWNRKFSEWSTDALLDSISDPTDDRIYAIAELCRRGVDTKCLASHSQIDRYFVRKIGNIVREEKKLKRNIGNPEALKAAKKMGFSDKAIAWLWGKKELEIYVLRKQNDIFPVYRMIDTCASELQPYIPYFYSTYEGENESIVSEKRKIIVLGSGPIRIGQGIEFDYSTVHAAATIREQGYEAIIINNNPETVSTDYTTSDKLYFEPLCVEDVMNVLKKEKPIGVIASLGGQTALNLAQPLAERGVKLIGTDCDAIDRAENRKSFENLLRSLNIPQPKGQAVTKIEDGIVAAREIGYPVLVRPSFVLGGRAMQIVANEEQLRHYLKTAVEIDEDKPVLVDQYIFGKEVEVDAVCDGTDVFCPGIMELVERTGVHSGDSISVYPPFSLSQKVKEIILNYTKKLGLGIGIIGLYNIQFIVDKNEDVSVIEVNPRSSRTVPFLSKSTGCSLPDIGTKVILGTSLKEQGFTEIYPPEKKRWYVKCPAFSFSKLKGLDPYLSPEMKSTGEAMGTDERLNRAMEKAMAGGGLKLRRSGTVFARIADEDREEILPLIQRFSRLGFQIEATSGNEIFDSICRGDIAYLIHTRSFSDMDDDLDGIQICKAAAEHSVPVLTCPDTMRAVLEVLEESRP